MITFYINEGHKSIVIVFKITNFLGFCISKFLCVLTFNQNCIIAILLVFSPPALNHVTHVAVVPLSHYFISD